MNVRMQSDELYRGRCQHAIRHSACIVFFSVFFAGFAACVPKSFRGMGVVLRVPETSYVGKAGFQDIISIRRVHR